MLLNNGTDFNLSRAACPRCGCKGNYKPHGSYTRSLVTLDGEVEVAVERVRCCSCRATHAVIPPDVVPYRAYSESFAVEMLLAWANGASNREVRDSFGVPETTRRRMLSQSRRRACALFPCGPARAAVAAAARGIGAAAVAASHALSFATRFAENVRLPNLHCGRRLRPTRFT